MTKFYRQAALRISLRKGDFSGYFPDPIYITGLRISFSIVKSLEWTTNSAIIKVWNLSQEHRNLIKDFGDEVTLYAGYVLDGGPQVLFVGNTTVASHVYEFPEIITVLECGDGEKFLNQLRVSVSFAANTSAKTILSTICKQMGFPVNSFDFADDLVYRQGYSFIGMGKDAIEDICAKLNLTASTQNNALQVIPKNGTLNQPSIIISENSGMQGVPQRFTFKKLVLWPINTINPATNPSALQNKRIPLTGYKVNVALNPLILPGYPITLESKHLGIRDSCVVDNVRHDGDTYGFNWTTQLEVTNIPLGTA